MAFNEPFQQPVTAFFVGSYMDTEPAEVRSTQIPATDGPFAGWEFQVELIGPDTPGTDHAAFLIFDDTEAGAREQAVELAQRQGKSVVTFRTGSKPGTFFGLIGRL